MLQITFYNVRSQPCAPRPPPQLDYPLFEVSGAHIRPCFSKWRQTSKLQIVQRKKFPTLTTLPRLMKTTPSAKPNSLKQRSWSERVFTQMTLTDFWSAQTEWWIQFFIISRGEHFYEEDLNCLVCLCQYLSVWNVIVLWFCRKTNDITQLFIWTTPTVVAFTKKKSQKKKEAKKAVVLNCIIVLHQRHLSCKNRQSTWTSPFVDLRSRSLAMMTMSCSGITHSFCFSDFQRRRFSVFIFGSREVTLQAIADNTYVRVRRHVGRWLSFSWCPGSTWGKNSFFSRYM